MTSDPTAETNGASSVMRPRCARAFGWINGRRSHAPSVVEFSSATLIEEFSHRGSLTSHLLSLRTPVLAAQGPPPPLPRGRRRMTRVPRPPPLPIAPHGEGGGGPKWPPSTP